MNDFTLYFNTGWHHIIGWNALDHILFIIALSAIYNLKNWKNILVLITAFTIGHSLTLALSVYDLFRLNDNLVEFLIPCTIMATALFNVIAKDFKTGSLRLNYFLALFFGLIHGMAFANTIRFMLAKDQRIGLPLISFNIGLEVGQVIVVTAILLIGFVAINKMKLQRKWWVWLLSGTAFFMALKMAVGRWPL